MKPPEHPDDALIHPNDDLEYTQDDWLLDTEMQQSLREWFSYELPDKVAYAIHRFLYDISVLFERTYDEEIRNFTKDNRLHSRHPHRADSIHTDPDDQLPWVDDEIEF